jgi:hypothetical protein
MVVVVEVRAQNAHQVPANEDHDVVASQRFRLMLVSFGDRSIHFFVAFPLLG